MGPILTAVVSTPTGPLALLRDVVLNPLPTLSQLEENCGGTVDVSCLEAGRAGFAGPLGLALAVVPVVLLLICADGMRQGRRLALRIAIIVQLGVTALAAVYLALFARIPHYPNRPHTAVMGSGFVHVLPLVAVPLLLVVLLWLNRRQFRVETTPRARRILGLVVGGTWLGLAGAYTVAWLAAGGIGPRRGTAGPRGGTRPAVPAAAHSGRLQPALPEPQRRRGLSVRLCRHHLLGCGTGCGVAGPAAAAAQYRAEQYRRRLRGPGHGP